MGSSFDVGVVGCGKIATERHVPALKANERVSVTAVYDHHWANAEKTAADFDVAMVFDDYDSLLATDLDLVTIATPPFTHADLTIDSLEHGTNVLCEKPMAVEESAAERMVEAAANSEASLGIVHNFLYARSMRKARRLLEQDAFGEVRYVKGIQFSSPRRDLPSWYTRLPGGLYYDESPHLLYLMEHFIGGLELLDASAQRDQGPGQPLESVTATFEGDAGRQGQLSMVFDAPLSEWFFVIVGTKRLAVVDIFRDIIVHVGQEADHSPLEVLQTAMYGLGQIGLGIATSGLHTVRGDLFFGYGRLLDEYLDALEASEPAPIPPEEGLRIVSGSHAVLDHLDCP